MFDSPESTKIRIPAFAAAAVVIGVLITFLLGVYPEPVIELAREAVFSTVQVLAGS
jgi:NADH:ubiquinone oxidoreductase subunit 4 (subunit M)